jgi:vitamin B12 transporter
VILAALLMMLQGPATDSVRVCAQDAHTGEPVVGVSVRAVDGATHTAAGACTSVRGGVGTALAIMRVGYVPRSVVLRGDNMTMYVMLEPRTGRGVGDSLGFTVLTAQRVTAAAPVMANGARVQATISAQQARERGVGNMNGVIALLPYTTFRSARGESGLSLRGARREQVVITLDGLPLNDPATGLADVADVPLVALQSATVLPGADPLGAGSGASGGVLSLTTGAQRTLSVRSGAFGQRVAEGAWAGVRQQTRWHGALSHRTARNDFAFENAAGAQPVKELRINNDERRTVFTGGLVSARTQWNLLVSTGERGMVGPANVRAYDSDRSQTTRVLVRGQTALGNSMLSTGARGFALRYRDPANPSLDSRATAWASDAEWRGPVAGGNWRLGVGADGLTATGNVQQQRARGFAAWGWHRPGAATQRVQADAGVRADVVERSGVLPTASAGSSVRLAGTRTGSAVMLVSRVAQAVRVPTLYDLYFSSPQRLDVRALSPERVALDASTGLQGVWQATGWRATGEVQAVARDTRDAIVWFPGNFGWSPANVGRERLRGTEARVDLNARAVSLGLWHTWYRTTLRSGGLTIPTPYVPLHSVGGQGLWQRGAHALSAVVRYQGRRPFTAGPRNPLFELPAVTLLDMAITRRQTFTHLDALLTAGLDNATNVRWQSVRGFPMPGRGWSASLTLQPRP